MKLRIPFNLGPWEKTAQKLIHLFFRFFRWRGERLRSHPRFDDVSYQKISFPAKGSSEEENRFLSSFPFSSLMPAGGDRGRGEAEEEGANYLCRLPRNSPKKWHFCFRIYVLCSPVFLKFFF